MKKFLILMSMLFFVLVFFAGPPAIASSEDIRLEMAVDVMDENIREVAYIDICPLPVPKSQNVNQCLFMSFHVKSWDSSEVRSFHIGKNLGVLAGSRSENKLSDQIKMRLLIVL